MKYSLLFAFFALFVFACGEVEGAGDSSSSSETGDPSSSSGGNVGGTESSSSGESSLCQGQNCCNGTPFDPKISFCEEYQLYPLCNNRKYNPYEQGCFEGALYPRCDLERTRGTCVHESLLRCKQEGEGADKIVRPQPGMKCEENGKITGVVVDIRDEGREYKIVQIGNQMWMAENLKYVPSPEGGAAANSKCYGDNSENCETYGRLYDWATAMVLPEGCNFTNQSCPSSRPSGLWGGLCPPSFGFPKSADWQTLIAYAGSGAVAANRLKSTTGWSNNGNGTDSYGFNALPSGYYTDLKPDNFYDLNSRAMWWHDEQLVSEAHYTTIISSDTEAKINFHQKGYNMAQMRCVHYF